MPRDAHGLRNEFCLISEVIFDRLSHHRVCLTLGKFLSWASKKARGLNALMKPIYILSASRCATRGKKRMTAGYGLLCAARRVKWWAMRLGIGAKRRVNACGRLFQASIVLVTASPISGQRIRQ
jgi:hypothetical protein